ncbi:MAG: hypothetical protein IPM38_10035 [Ignavibacteria bacterium]|nr:hypothetical protein [Ignavibacteria bacterium]
MKDVFSSFRTPVIYLTILITVVIFSRESISQVCTNTSVGLTPINDLGSGYFRSYQGGLYPNGNNVRPVVHDDDGVDIGLNIVPLDTGGNYDSVNGRVVLLSVGMSNCAQEFQQFMQNVNGATYLNPKLVIINGAQGGQTIDIINNPNANFWTVIIQRLAAAGLTVKQVQAIWFKEAQANPSDTAFPNYPDSLKEKFKTCMGIMKTKYINLKQCYLASRIYAGYATGTLNPEPYSYYSGWSVKWLIEDQINGDTSLIYNGINKNSPWLSWGPYTWADGIIPRIDGLTWICPADFAADGTHPSAAGRQKVALRIDDFFKRDETSKPWYLRSVTINVTTAMEGFLNSITGNLNMRDTVRVYLRNNTSPYNALDSSKAIIDSVSMKGIYKFYNITNGTYYLQVRHRNSIETWSSAGGESMTTGSIYNYDFTTSDSQAYGNNMVLKDGEYCLYSGDVNQDGLVDLTDNFLIDNDAIAFMTGYLSTDVNGDSVTDLSDAVIADNNALNFVGKVTP